MSDATNPRDEELEKPILIGFLYGIQSDFLSRDEVRHRIKGFRTTKGYKEAMNLIHIHDATREGEIRLEEINFALEHAYDGFRQRMLLDRRDAILNSKQQTGEK